MRSKCSKVVECTILIQEPASIMVNSNFQAFETRSLSLTADGMNDDSMNDIIRPSVLHGRLL
jgi:hypothetical protein